MAVYLINYKLESPGKDYTQFHETVKNTTNGWFSYFDDSWIVNSNLTAQELAQKLYPHMTKADRLLIVKITRDYYGWLPQEAWKWLSERQF